MNVCMRILLYMRTHINGYENREPPRHTNRGERGAVMREANANLTNLTSSVKLDSAYEIRLHGIRARQKFFFFKGASADECRRFFFMQQKKGEYAAYGVR